MLICLGGLAACTHKAPGNATLHPVTLSWEAAEGGRSGSRPTTYNVYAVQGAGPIPTEASKSCGDSQVAKGRPVNSDPITVTTYRTTVAEGLWTFAVEAVSSDGCRSALSSLVTVRVPIPHDSPADATAEPRPLEGGG